MARKTVPDIDAAEGGNGVLDDGSMAKAIAMAERGIETDIAEKGMRQRKRDVVAPPVGKRDESPVEVICVVTNRPWTDERPLKHKERATVPRWVADLMEKNGQVVVV